MAIASPSVQNAISPNSTTAFAPARYAALSMRAVTGKPIKLTIDGALQDYAARRIGLESGTVVVIDCLTGGILALTSMPAFDPNSFVDGIGRIEWKMLNEDDHIPLLNKALRGLYPPGSTMKPMASLALQQHGVSPDERVSCPGGYRLGSRFFRCDAVHGSMDMRSAIEHSCNTYFWSMAHRVGYDAIAPVAKLLGLGPDATAEEVLAALAARMRPAVDFLHVGVILGFRQHTGDDPSLAGHTHAPLGAELLEPAFPGRCFGHWR